MILRQTLTIFTIVLLALTACAADREDELSGTVTWIYDGDTIEVDGIGKVRLIGIDTPEQEDSGRDWYFQKQGISSLKLRETYQAAKRYNIENAKGKQVNLELDHPPRDKYGRLLAYVKLPDGRILNMALLKNGLAVVYRKFSFQKKDDFLRAEEQARKNKLGLWAE